MSHILKNFILRVICTEKAVANGRPNLGRKMELRAYFELLLCPVLAMGKRLDNVQFHLQYRWVNTEGKLMIAVQICS